MLVIDADNLSGGTVFGVQFHIDEVRVPEILVQQVELDFSCDIETPGSPCVEKRNNDTNNGTKQLLSVHCLFIWSCKLVTQTRFL